MAKSHEPNTSRQCNNIVPQLPRAGVIGLQTAIFLLEEGYKVTIIAEHFPGDTSLEYTSPWYALYSLEA